MRFNESIHQKICCSVGHAPGLFAGFTPSMRRIGIPDCG